MFRNYKFRLYPTKSQITKLNNCLDECRFVYNHFLQKRKEAWESEKKSIHLYTQTVELPELKKIRPSLKNVHSHCIQNVVVRIDLAYQIFFRNLKIDPSKAGLPKFKSKKNYDSITYSQFGNGAQLKDKLLRLSRIGDVYIELHRPLMGKPKTVTIKKERTGKWYATFSCEVEIKRKAGKRKPVGIDLGITTFGTLSNKEEIANPRFYEKEMKSIAKLSRRLKANPTNKNRHSLALAHERIANKRLDFHHKESAKLVSQYSHIFIEDLDVSKMAEKHWVSRQIADVGWYSFTEKICHKAEEAGVGFTRVNPAYTSQDCSRCGHREFKKLADRQHVCGECGLSMPRDLNAAINIKTRGLASLAKA